MAGNLGTKTFVTGIQRTARNLKALQRVILRESGKGARDYLLDTILDAQANFVPVDTGALRSSGFVKKIKWKGDDEFRVRAGFGQDSVLNPKTGNPTSDYAWVQHETNPNGKSKYLSQPARKNIPKLKTNIESRIQKSIVATSLAGR